MILYPKRESNSIIQDLAYFFQKLFFFCLQLLNGITLTQLYEIIKLQCFYKQYSEMFKTRLNNVFDCHNFQGIKFITQQSLSFYHLRKYEFKGSFPDSLNPMWNYCRDVESTSYFLF